MSKEKIKIISKNIKSIKLTPFNKFNGEPNKWFKETNLYKETVNLKEEIRWFQGNWSSMSNKHDPTKVRCRSDKFLSNIKNDKNISHKENVILLSSFKYNDKIIHSIVSGYWFSNYKHSTNSSNSFINIEYSELIDMLESNGFYYKNTSKKSGQKQQTKYVIYFFEDNNFEINNFFQYIELSRNLHNNYSDSLNLFSKYDPSIPKNSKIILYELFNDSCAVHTLNPDFCKTKIDWQATKKAISNTNLNVPVDFHHFISREIFKKAWNRHEIDELDWKMIHDKINLLPLCQICHQSIHNKDKGLAEETFNYILRVYEKNGALEDFLNFLNKSQVLNNIEELKRWYINNEI